MNLLRFASSPSVVRNARGSSIFLRGARQVVTLQGPHRMRAGDELEDVGLLHDASVLIRDGRITQIGSARRLEHLEETSSACWVDARNLIVIPGYVDAVDIVPQQPKGPDADDSSLQHGAPAGPLSRLVSRSLQRLLLGGTSFCCCSFHCPADPTERMRMLRQLLRVDLPVGAFQALLHIDPSWLFRHGCEAANLRDVLLHTQKTLWPELQTLLALSFDVEDLRKLGMGAATRLLRACARQANCVVRNASQLGTHELLDLGLASPWLAADRLPDGNSLLAHLAAWGMPWMVTVGEAALIADDALGRLGKAVSLGMRLAIATGYREGAMGVASPLALTAMLHQQTSLPVSHLLQLQIANMAHASGEGGRMGTLEVGKEANLLLLDCEDYRDIGRAVGASQVIATMRRGETEGRWSSLLAG